MENLMISANAVLPMCLVMASATARAARLAPP